MGMSIQPNQIVKSMSALPSYLNLKPYLIPLSLPPNYLAPISFFFLPLSSSHFLIFIFPSLSPYWFDEAYRKFLEICFFPSNFYDE